MRHLSELLDTADPAFPLIQQWASAADLPVELLPPSADRAEVLLALQVTTRSAMGALAYESGGILVDGGWLRILGSGHPRLERSITAWNAGKSDGFLLVADDVLGGFFAVNGGGLGDGQGMVYYLAPDTLVWESLEVGFTDFVEWALTSRIRAFYGREIMEKYAPEVDAMSGEQCFGFFPFLWTREGSHESSARRAVPVEEQWKLNQDLLAQV
ncbi:DUF2625 family protein [Massilia violaceinigra]|uniref:DUF2625 family protein n=1 Tax=Massilia violaceinigra TaxID=2045208 RepID=A0ABY4A285_9BURK|nr:DUF2625 family protein [Massilia violaceinigra]UOD28862.1 DUF2625 family protein [Massilia violaceinigra]